MAQGLSLQTLAIIGSLCGRRGLWEIMLPLILFWVNPTPFQILQIRGFRIQQHRRPAPGRVHHHPAGGAHLLPVAALHARAQDQGGAAGAGDRAPLSKPQILELYMNQIYLGQRSYGFAAAAQAYFGKPLDQLSIAETAMLAGLPQNPHYANPVTNLERATQRQRIVLARMVATGVPSRRAARRRRAEKLQLRGPASRPARRPCGRDGAPRGGGTLRHRGLHAGPAGAHSLRAADQQAAVAAVRAACWPRPPPALARPGGPGEPAPRWPGSWTPPPPQALKDHRDDETCAWPSCCGLARRSVQVQLASGERVAASPAKALRWAAGAAAQGRAAAGDPPRLGGARGAGRAGKGGTPGPGS
jgi:hypothetical protein